MHLDWRSIYEHFYFLDCAVTELKHFSFSLVYFHRIYQTNQQYIENFGGENQKEQSSKWMVTQI